MASPRRSDTPQATVVLNLYTSIALFRISIASSQLFFCVPVSLHVTFQQVTMAIEHECERCIVELNQWIVISLTALWTIQRIHFTVGGVLFTDTGHARLKLFAFM